jgi:hypothetical protein
MLTDGVNPLSGPRLASSIDSRPPTIDRASDKRFCALITPGN